MISVVFFSFIRQYLVKTKIKPPTGYGKLDIDDASPNELNLYQVKNYQKD